MAKEELTHWERSLLQTQCKPLTMTYLELGGKSKHIPAEQKRHQKHEMTTGDY